MKTRKQIDARTIDEIVNCVKQKTISRLDEKGWDSYIGPHETFGIIAEEIYELLKALWQNDKNKTFKRPHNRMVPVLRFEVASPSITFTYN